MDDSSTSSSGSGGSYTYGTQEQQLSSSRYPLHDICDSPNDDPILLQSQLFISLNNDNKPANQTGFGFDDDSDDEPAPLPPSDSNSNTQSSEIKVLSPYINSRDPDDNTPLHLALTRCNIECVRTLLSVGADNISLTKKCDGSFPVHVVSCLSALTEFTDQCLELIDILNSHSAVDWCLKDDDMKTPLLLSVQANCLPVSRKILETIKSRQTDRTYEQLNLKGGREGLKTLHIAIKNKNIDMLEFLVEENADVNVTDNQGNLPIHVAAENGWFEGVNRLKEFMGEDADEKENVRGRTWKQVATNAGYTIHDSTSEESTSKTKIYSHSLCSSHYSCPPITRGGADENINRLHVLINKTNGTLRTNHFSTTTWDESCQRASIADVLRVHDYKYVENLTKKSHQLPDRPSQTYSLDPDTSISRWSFEAAMRAAGSLTQAVDDVMSGNFQNGFCAIRPPGHHAGPRGVVTCPNDPAGSHGFCLLNNVAIGAAYAKNIYRKKIKKVAIVDFDVHHGNGTEACVEALLPNVIVTTFESDFANFTVKDMAYKPWLSEDDSKNVFFSSTHGYGPRDYRIPPNVGGWFYPASGATGNTVEDETNDIPVEEFIMSQQWTRMGNARSNCNIINCGLPLPVPSDIPGMQRVNTRDAYRKNIFPALVDFDPDFIFISAGFDAHAKDSMNFGYVGMVEEDYEWVTREIVKIANLCCEGRVVSCLEGGYKIHGKMISPFAKAVQSHVKALVDGGQNQNNIWTQEDADFESDFETRAVEAKERKRQALLERQREDARMELVRMQERQEAAKLLAEQGVTENSAGEEEPGSPSKKRRRADVDYKKLDEEMEE
ncbi:hypothetical protein TL16_g00928 [Triparma laevis f. inornata]|uniref:Histone deacetylase domain-containing protein n=2 Tax=Triparma laevis TaxID=1534972 RepID=A0A9W6ZJB2_9STRA|nr:hypothetical protein TL16_g00928 [Triparma laevis f. inornata]